MSDTINPDGTLADTACADLLWALLKLECERQDAARGRGDHAAFELHASNTVALVRGWDAIRAKEGK